VQHAQKNTHTSIQVQRKHSGLSPRNGFTAYNALSPATGFVVTVTCGTALDPFGSMRNPQA
jgi:hypothetical protein